MSHKHAKEHQHAPKAEGAKPVDAQAGGLAPEEGEVLIVEKEAGGNEAEAMAEIAELKDKLLRAYAETENVRKRARRDVEDARKFAIERFAAELLGVVDNLERALGMEHDNAKALQEGVQMTLDSWHGLMKKFDIKRVDAVGQKLDPHLHEAIAHIPSEAEAGIVIEQHLPGYTLHDRLLRAAMVVVSSGPANEDKQEPEQE